MVDVLNPKQRSFCMSRIRGRDTKPEILLRRALWKQGLRYRVRTQLTGKPDIVFTKQKIAIFVDGCFWHGCKKHYNPPKTSTSFWAKKIERTRARDQFVNSHLEEEGWTVIRIWEHSLENDLDTCIFTILARLQNA